MNDVYEQARRVLDDAKLSPDVQYKVLRCNAEKLYRFTLIDPEVKSA